jgi:hypothetical protein
MFFSCMVYCQLTLWPISNLLSKERNRFNFVADCHLYSQTPIHLFMHVSFLWLRPPKQCVSGGLCSNRPLRRTLPPSSEQLNHGKHIDEWMDRWMDGLIHVV